MPVPERKTILVVDDDEVLCELTTILLERLGYHCSAVRDPEAALQIVSCNPGQFDLVLADHLLGRSTGIELAAELQRIRPGIPVVLYTGNPADLQGLPSKGICAVIEKGLTRQEFAKELRRVLSLLA